MSEHEPGPEEVREALRMVGRQPAVPAAPQSSRPAPAQDPRIAWPGAAPATENLPDQEELERLRRKRTQLFLQQ